MNTPALKLKAKRIEVPNESNTLGGAADVLIIKAERT